MREATSKLLPVHDGLRYIFASNVNVLTPVAIMLLVYDKRYIASFVYFVVATTYAVISLAKAPVFLSVMIILVASLQVQKLSVRRRIYLVALIALISIGAHVVSLLSAHPQSVLCYKASDSEVRVLRLVENDPRLALTRGDHKRLQPTESKTEMSAVETAYNYLVYRLFLGPADVSHRWFQYFPRITGGYIGLDGLTPSTRQTPALHPARRVGQWAYADRFPDKYLESAQAYASVDADSYTRFGVSGIFVTAFILLLLRLTLRLLRTQEPSSHALYSAGLLLCSAFWPMASIQAVLVSNGVLFILVLTIGAKMLCAKKSETKCLWRDFSFACEKRASKQNGVFSNGKDRLSG